MTADDGAAVPAASAGSAHEPPPPPVHPQTPVPRSVLPEPHRSAQPQPPVRRSRLGALRRPGASFGRLRGRLVNPLATKELLARMRGPRAFIVATTLLLPLAVVAALLYSMIASMPNSEVSGAVSVGKLFFAAVTGVELGLICLLAPALTADLISGERERRTLDLLLVTPLSRRQIVVGKLVAALGSLLVLIVLALPIQAVAVLIGGVGWEELLLGLLILTLTATTYGCVGLYWSACVRTTRGAMLLSYITTLAGVGGMPLAFVLALLGSGLFGTRYMEDMLWPLIWLMNGPQALGSRFTTTSAVIDSPLTMHLQVGIGQLLVATNPLLTGVTSAAALVTGRPVVGLERVANVELVYIAPWLLFAAAHLLASGALIWLTARTLRRMTA
jgi:ABC-type transport system involved in multi-copper enzyme maturation permease subunit